MDQQSAADTNKQVMEDLQNAWNKVARLQQAVTGANEEAMMLAVRGHEAKDEQIRALKQRIACLENEAKRGQEPQVNGENTEENWKNRCEFAEYWYEKQVEETTKAIQEKESLAIDYNKLVEKYDSDKQKWESEYEFSQWLLRDEKKKKKEQNDRRQELANAYTNAVVEITSLEQKLKASEQTSQHLTNGHNKAIQQKDQELQGLRAELDVANEAIKEKDEELIRLRAERANGSN